jgi:hypothetical protein
MALVERLMGDLGETKIPVHDFFAACSELLGGNLTVAQIKTFLEMDIPTQVEFDALVTLAPTGTNATAVANKSMYVNKMHAVFVLAESRYPQYSTPAEVRLKLGL